MQGTSVVDNSPTSIPVAVGSHEIRIVVASSDSSNTGIYIITVTRAASSDAAVISTAYTVNSPATSTGTIANVPYGTTKADFETALAKDEPNQTWDDSGVSDPVVTGDTLVVTAQDGTIEAYTITANPQIFISFAPTTNSDGSISMTIPSTTEASANSSGVTTTINIPTGAVISGTSTWNGIFTLPQATTTFVAPTPDSGFTVSVVAAVEIGAGDVALTSDQAVRLLFAGQTGKLVGWSRAGTFSPITNICSADTQTVGNTLAADGDCKFDNGTDLIVWTKHFTTFEAYTEAAIPVTPSVGNGGGGGGGGGGSSPVYSGTQNVSIEQVLGASAFNFTKNLTLGSRGGDVTQLQNVLIQQGLFSGTATGYFGRSRRRQSEHSSGNMAYPRSDLSGR